jgi:hypothetical protein
MSVKSRLVKAIAPKAVTEVLNRQDRIIEECMICKNNDGEAVKACEFWVRKRLHRCERVADIIEGAVNAIRTESLMPVENAIVKATEVTASAADRMKALKDRVVSKFRKK